MNLDPVVSAILILLLLALMSGHHWLATLGTRFRHTKREPPH